jgi:hypothetical protein
LAGQPEGRYRIKKIIRVSERYHQLENVQRSVKHLMASEDFVDSVADGGHLAHRCSTDVHNNLPGSCTTTPSKGLAQPQERQAAMGSS